MYLCGNGARALEFFGFGWYFRHADEYGDEAGAGLEGYRPVQLPHDWSVEYPFDKDAPTCGSGGFVKAGIGWYKKRFYVSGGCEGKLVSLMFDGAYMCAKAWLNGAELGEHVYGYTPFEFDISGALHFDSENELIVRINNSFQPNSRWYTGSGITRDVWLKCTGHDYIPTYGTYITTDVRLGREAGEAGEAAGCSPGAAGSGLPSAGEAKNPSARVNIATRVILSGAGAAILETSVTDAGGALLGRAETGVAATGEIIQAVDINNVNLWSADTPYLYTAKSALRRNGAILDVYETPFGARSIGMDPDMGCIINGRQVKLNGVCVHHDGGAAGAAVPNKMWRRRLLLLKEMGCNAIRCSHNPPDPGLLDLCDELGFYVMDEAFDEWGLLKQKIFGSNTHESRGYSEWFEEHHVSDIEAMLYRDRNHPSVIMWSIGNEVPEQTRSDGHLLAKELQDICHRIDPTRLCIQANDQICAEPRRATDEFLNTLDIVGYNYTGRWRKRAETLYDDDKRANPGRRILGAENPSAAGRRGDYRLEMPANTWRRAYFAAPVHAGTLLRYTMTRDFVAGDFMWTGIDYLGEAFWPDRSSSSGVIDTCGYPKDHFYFYKSIWDRDNPMVHIFPHRNLDWPDGKIIPVLCYTNCVYAELFVGGRSYGKKAYSYPLYGMTETYAHYDTPPVAANTNDLFLCWDVPVSSDRMEAVGYDRDGAELCRHVVEAAGAPAAVRAAADTGCLMADGRDIAHIDVEIVDGRGVVHPTASNPITVNVDGPATLIGIDNGRPDCHEAFKGDTMQAFGGKLLAVVQAGAAPGAVTVSISSGGLTPAVVRLDVR